MIKSLLMRLGLRWLGTQCREMAEGKQGPALQKAYLWMIGKKRIIGGVFAVVTVALAAAGQPELAAILTGTVAAVFTSAGFIDANWREEPRLDSAWLRSSATTQSTSRRFSPLRLLLSRSATRRSRDCLPMPT